MPRAPKGKKKYYWDTSVFIDLIEKHPDRFATLEHLMQQCADGDLQIYTSTWTMAELIYAEEEKTGQALKATVQQKINKLWDPSSKITLVEVHQVIAQKSQDISRRVLQDKLKQKPPVFSCLKAKDAIHFGTIEILHAAIGLHEVHTYDADWPKLQRFLSVPVTEPTVHQPVLPGIPRKPEPALPAATS